MDWFLYDRDLHYERVEALIKCLLSGPSAANYRFFLQLEGYDSVHTEHIRIPSIEKNLKIFKFHAILDLLLLSL